MPVNDGYGPAAARPPVVQAQLCVEAQRAEEQLLCAASRRWFEEGVEMVGGGLWRRLRQRPVPPGEGSQRWAGDPGDVWGETSITYPHDHDWGGYTDDDFQQLLEAAQGPSIILALTMYEL